MKEKKIMSRTVPGNNLIMRSRSLFAAKQEPLPNNEGWGWKARVIPIDYQELPITIAMRSRTKHRRNASKIFDYAISVASAEVKLKYKELSREDPGTFPAKMSFDSAFASDIYKVSIRIADFLVETGLKVYYHNIRNAISDLESLVETSVKVKQDKGVEFIFSLLVGVSVDGIGSETVVDVTLPTNYFQTMDAIGKKRFVNFTHAAKIRSIKATELWKFIQARSRGLNSDGELHDTVKEFMLLDAAQFLGIKSVDSAKVEISRALKELKLSYKRTTRKDGLIVYVNNTRNNLIVLAG